MAILETFGNGNGSFFDEEEAHLQDMLATPETDDDTSVVDPITTTGQLSWEDSHATGLHLDGSWASSGTQNGRHSSYIGGMLRAGHDLPSIEGLDAPLH